MNRITLAVAALLCACSGGGGGGGDDDGSRFAEDASADSGEHAPYPVDVGPGCQAHAESGVSAIACVCQLPNGDRYAHCECARDVADGVETTVMAQRADDRCDECVSIPRCAMTGWYPVD